MARKNKPSFARAYMSDAWWIVAAEHAETATKISHAHGFERSNFDAITSVIYAAMAAETWINEFVSWPRRLETPDSSDVLVKHLHSDLCKAINLASDLEKKRETTTNKFFAVSKSLAGVKLKKGAEPFQGLCNLFDYRNLLLHYKVHAIPKFVSKSMRSANPLANSQSNCFDDSWVDLIQTGDFAKWACKASRAAVTHVADQIS